MMKKALALAILALLAFAGCRQKDMREMTVPLPGLAPIAGDTNELAKAETQIKVAFATYEKHYDANTGRLVQENPLSGVDLGSIRLSPTSPLSTIHYPLSTPSLTVRFDSLQVAEMNVIDVLNSLEVKDVKPVGPAAAATLRPLAPYPKLVEGAPAGYINTRKEEVK